ncbi:MAG: SDR family NAD(P)-dependent oxidoreductase [Sneathiella sp.]|nr:SDR family NAD(P)-dependent oxidoreductase [Sneathiella sp.]
MKKTAIVTGANTGLGYETARALYLQGMHVIVASRNANKGQEAVERIRASAPDAKGELEFSQLNLSSLEDVKTFADWANRHLDHLDLLINNAGVMAAPPARTHDGYETQFGVNFVAHFALTGRLFPLLEKTPGSRVVSLSSRMHRGAVIDFDNFALEKPYDPGREYGQSKLAKLIFAMEFDRRLRAKDRQLMSLAAHPGISRTDLFRYQGQIPDGIKFMSAADGAAPTVMAATLATAQGGQYFGPDGPGEARGKPALARVDAAASDVRTNSKLWHWAEEATGVHYP